MMAKLGKRQVAVLTELGKVSPEEYTMTAAKCRMVDEWGARPSFDAAVLGLERMGYAQVTKDGVSVLRWTIEITDAGRAALAEQEQAK